MKAVYRIYNQSNGKNYIGSSKNVETRLSSHQSNLKNNRHPIKELQTDYNNGDNFRYEIVKESSSIKNLHIDEIYYIGKFNSVNFGYNSTYIVSLSDTLSSFKRTNLINRKEKLKISYDAIYKQTGIYENEMRKIENGTLLPSMKSANKLFALLNDLNPSVSDLSFIRMFERDICRIKEYEVEQIQVIEGE